MTDGKQIHQQHRKLLRWLRMLLCVGFSSSFVTISKSRSRHIYTSTCTHMANIRGVRHTNKNFVPKEENDNENDFSQRRSSSTYSSSSSSSSSSPYSNPNGHDYERVSLNVNVKNIDEVEINLL